MTAPVIVWFRRDLRTIDNPALYEAARSGKPVIALYVFETDKSRPLGGASKWWLHHSLVTLSQDLEALGVRLLIQKGWAAKVLETLAKDTGADHVVWNRRYSKGGIARDRAIKTSLSERGIKAESFKANLLDEPWTIETGSGGYYKVFTPYWKSVLRGPGPNAALAAPRKITPYRPDIECLNLSALDLLPTNPNWGAKMSPYWTPGSTGALEALEKFLDGPAETYGYDRDRPDRMGTSRLSPHLAFGEISPRQIWHAARNHVGDHRKFLSEIGWREFSYNLLFNNPDLATSNFKSYFDGFEWQISPQSLERWQMGQTGYPFVDAGMRQLWGTGWQHNRVRMVTASFLIKHLMLDWREGEAWFWDTLVDADPASNAASWQWVAGSGADASPFFRIFNPITQGEKFDPNGDYVRRWVPELGKLPNKFIHKPWEAPQDLLEAADICLGETYPKPIVDHNFARERALAAYKKLNN